MDSEQHFQKELDSRISSFTSRAHRERKIAHRILLARIVLMVLIAAGPLFAHLLQMSSEAATGLAAILAAILGGLEAYERTTQPRERWVLFRSVSNSLKSMRTRIRYEGSRPELKRRVEQYLALLGDANSTWQEFVLSQEDERPQVLSKDQASTDEKEPHLPLPEKTKDE